MTIEEFKTAMRSACDHQAEALAKLMAEFAQELARLETAVKADPLNDRELISLVIEAEVRRYGERLDKL